MLDRYCLTHEEINKGGTLKMEITNKQHINRIMVAKLTFTSGFLLACVLIKAADFYTCGNADIEWTRKEISLKPTDTDNLMERSVLLYNWMGALQQQGAEWTGFQGDIHNTGYTEAPGSKYGRQAWKFPFGLGGYRRPFVEDGRVYVASPGMYATSFCQDIETGEEIWKSTREHPIYGIYKIGSRIEESTFCIYRNKFYLLAKDDYVHSIE